MKILVLALLLTIWTLANAADKEAKRDQVENAQIDQLNKDESGQKRISAVDAKGKPPACECTMTGLIPGPNDEYGVRLANCSCGTPKGELACVVALPITRFGGLGTSMHCQ